MKGRLPAGRYDVRWWRIEHKETAMGTKAKVSQIGLDVHRTFSIAAARDASSGRGVRGAGRGVGQGRVAREAGPRGSRRAAEAIVELAAGHAGRPGGDVRLGVDERR